MNTKGNKEELGKKVPVTSEKKVLIVPPGLKERYETFIDHYNVAEGAPILILGPTGVGKTLFYAIYKDLFNKENPYHKARPVIQVNCAHFGNQNSDPNIARSELFGTHKDSKLNFNVKEGLIHQAKGGILFLEEIGELPIAVQAMLLTFIEDKTFRRLGGNKDETSDCRIVAATNNESALREDFKNRFFPFSLPPIHERRNDIMYYFYEKDRDLLASLFKDEILELLSYNWPGNVREIERVAFLMRRTLIKRKRLVSQRPLQLLDRDWLKLLKMAEIDLGGSYCHKNINIYDELIKIGADAEYLESLLKNYGLSFIGLYKVPDYCPFKKIENSNPQYKQEEIDEYTIRIYDKYEPFEKAYEGIKLFCSLFLQNHSGNKNVLKDLTECYCNISFSPVDDFKVSNKSKFNKLKKSIFFFLSGIELDKSDKWPDDYRSLVDFLEQQAKIHPENRFLSSMLPDFHNDKKIPSDMIDQMASFTQEDLLRAYYKKILELSKGNVSAASRRIGIANQTFRDALKELGIKKSSTHILKDHPND